MGANKGRERCRPTATIRGSITVSPYFCFPAKAGIHSSAPETADLWVPACAGTMKRLMLARQSFHRLVDTGEGQREHAVVDELTDHPDRHRAAPIFLRHRVEPHRPRVMVQEPARPHRAGFVVPTLDTAALTVDLVGA